ncbi:unnamed protein product [Soboliphyme baturini]|uniref:MUTSd domain-containing protein n=1 Tax=Soboliphyme baturini TaxID=241478 RepID=A0A183IVU3_9BILA|nr:unnamed protein product [Soboliphyme baturini]
MAAAGTTTSFTVRPQCQVKTLLLPPLMTRVAKAIAGRFPPPQRARISDFHNCSCIAHSFSEERIAHPSRRAVRSLGALIRYCNLKTIRCASDAAVSDSDASTFTFLKTFSLEHVLKIDEVTYQALQIFQLMNHPSVYKAGLQGFKEGFSLFSLFSRCRSIVGTMELRRWFLRPLYERSVLQDRLDAVNYFFKSDNAQLAQAMRKQLQHVKRLTNVLTRMQLCKVKPNDWVSLYRTVYSCIYLQDLVRIRENIPKFLTDYMSTNPKEVLNVIYKLERRDCDKVYIVKTIRKLDI